MVSGRIVNVDEEGIDLEVIDVLKGEESREVIRIWDGTDFDCNGPFSMAASDLGGLNDTILVILPLITEVENTWDVLGDFRRPDYFEFTPELIVMNGVVHGFISGPYWSPTWLMPYLDLVSNWSNDLDACVALSVEAIHQAPPFTAYLDGIGLVLNFREDMALGSTIRILTMSGLEVMSANVFPGSMRMDLGGHAMGVYLITLVQPSGTRSTIRVVKMQ